MNTQDYPRVSKRSWLLLALLALLTGLTWQTVFALRPDFRLHVDFYDVGQGDATLITTASRAQVLIDGGPDSAAIMRKLGSSLPFFDRTIELVVLTHPHADHVTGLIEVLRRYRVGHILLTRAAYDSGIYAEFLRVVKEKKIPSTIARAGQVIHLDSATTLTTLHPLESLEGSAYKDANETSIVNRLSYGATSFLFTGDAVKRNEADILAAGENIAASVLKVGHQGSKTSTDPEFLRAVSPEYAVIFVGAENRYGHPHQETLDLLQAGGIKYFRTDEAGDVMMSSDGYAVRVDSPREK